MTADVDPDWTTTVIGTLILAGRQTQSRVANLMSPRVKMLSARPVFMITHLCTMSVCSGKSIARDLTSLTDGEGCFMLLC